MRHDGSVVLERVADVAIFVRVRPIGSIIQLVWVVDVVVPLIAIVLPRNAVGVEVVADAGRRGGWNRKRSVRGILVDIGILAVAEPARVVIVEQVVVTGLATRVDTEGGKVAHDRPYSGLRDIRAIAIGAAAIDRGNRIRRWITGVIALAIAVFRVPVVGAGSGVGVFDFIHDSLRRDWTLRHMVW